MSNLSPRAPAQDARKKRPLDLQRISFMWDLWTGLYMLEPWEKMVFSASPANCGMARVCACGAVAPAATRSHSLTPCPLPCTSHTRTHCARAPRRLPSGPI